MSTETLPLPIYSRELSPIAAYLQTVRSILLEPSHFFRLLMQQQSLSQGIGFGLVSLWLSSFVAFLFDAANKIVLSGFFRSFVDDDSFDASEWEFFTAKEFLMDAGYLLLNPFFSLLMFVLSASVLLFLARLLISRRSENLLLDFGIDPPEKASFSQILKILSFAAVGSWLSVIPLLGGILSYVAVSVLTVIGFRETFHISTRRSAFLVFLPQIIAVFFLFTLIFLMIVLASSSDILWQMQAGDDELDAFVRHVFIHYS